MSADLNSAACVAPPVGVFTRDTVTTAERVELSDAMRNGWITMAALTQDVWVLFGDSTVVSEDDGTPSVLTSEVPAISDEGWRIPAGEERHFDLRKRGDVTHFSHISAATGGKISWYKSSGHGNGV